jgi:gamma-D-glutamyl-L-lysine dipeptidyl-peptidase
MIELATGKMNHSTAICTLSMIPMRSEPKHKSEMVSMLLFGEAFTVNESLDHWHFITSRHDNYQGWIFSRYLHLVDLEFLDRYDTEKPAYCREFLSTAHYDEKYYYLCFGSRLPLYDGRYFYLGAEQVEYSRDVISQQKKKDTSLLIEIAKKYLHTPYLWGGRSLLGIDCSGYTQMVYALYGKTLPRDAWQQVKEGKPVKSLADARAGDLAFFSENGQRITHVGILTGDGHIIHASDDVRIDKISDKGIYNRDLKMHTLKVEKIRRIL